MRDLIDDIKTRILNSDQEFVLSSLSGTLRLIELIFPRLGSFLMEFIQNADDVRSTKIRFELYKDKIIIKNDGIEFSEEDIKSICKIGQSSKRTDNYIGYFGVGFKSIYLIAESVKIFSGKCSFGFKKGENFENYPWQIVPYWIPTDNESPRLDSFSTIFLIDLKSKREYELIKNEISDVINSRIILFLRNLERIEFYDYEKGYERLFFKEKINHSNNYYNIYQITEISEQNEKEEEIIKWLYFSKNFVISEDLKDDVQVLQWRKGLDSREVAIAIKLDEDLNIKEEYNATAHFGVYSFLPIKEVRSNLKYLIQGDFLTNIGRTDILRESNWNNWMAHNIFELIINEIIPILMKHDDWKYFIPYIFDSNYSGHPIIEKNLREPISRYLKSQSLYFDRSGKLISADQAIYIPEEISTFLTDKEVIELYDGKVALDPSYNLLPDFIKQSNYVFNTNRFTKEYEQLLELKARNKDLDFFKQFLTSNVLYYTNKGSIDKIKSRSFILTNDFTVSNRGSVYLNLNNIKIPKKYRAVLQIVNYKLIEDEKIENYFKNNLEIPILTEEILNEIINNALNTEILTDLKDKWNRYTEREKNQELINLKNLFLQGRLNRLQISHLKDFIEVKSSNNTWLNPSKLLFSRDYLPNNNIHEIVKKLNIFISSDLKILNKTRFLSIEFIKDSSDIDIINGWKEFFIALGVHSQLDYERAKFAEDIAIVTSMHYEKVQGREARNRSNQNRGYDLKSYNRNDTVNRYIEVKGSTTEEPNITLTAGENAYLSREDRISNYFVYIVTNIYEKPLLHILSAYDVLQIDKKDILLSFKEWANLKNIKKHDVGNFLD